MVVEVSRASEEVGDRLRAVLQREGQDTDRARHRVAPANPVPEPKHVVGVDAERRDPFEVRADRDHMLPHDISVGSLDAVTQPRTHRARVEHRLGGGECLAHDDGEGRLGVQAFEGAGDVDRINVRQETQAAPFCRFHWAWARAQGLRDELWAEIGATDPDRNDVRQGFARGAEVNTATHVCRE